MMRRNWLLSLACLAWILAPCLVFGQLVTATLEGTAQDKTGAAIANAKVIALNVSTGVITNAQTDVSGRFVFALLEPGGPYTVTVAAPGFETAVRSGIHLEVNQTADIAFTLQIGNATQKVEVNADATQLDTSNPSIGQVIGNRNVEDLPLNQRIVYQLMFLVPGVTGSVSYAYNSLNMSVDGARPGLTQILVDGIPATPGTANPISGLAAFPSVDAVQEFKVMGTGYSTEFGRSATGIINVILKSGTNQLHGSVYEFLRNSDLDANTFFANQAGTPLPSFKRSQYGVSLSGPVVFPKLYNGKDKTFFLFSYEGLRQGTQSETTTTVPTALQRNGDFSQTYSSSGALINIYDPATTTYNSSTKVYTRQTFTSEYNEGAGDKADCNGDINCIPASRFDPVAKNILNYYPLPNQTGTITGANNFFATGVSVLNTDTFDAKVDEVFNERNRMFVRYSRQNLANPPTLYFAKSIQVAEGGSSEPVVTSSASIDYTHTFSPNFVMEIPFGYSRIALNYLSNGTGFNPTSLGFPSYIAANADHLQFPGVSASNYVTLGNAGQGDTRHSGYSDFSLGINNTKVYRNHLIGFGFQSMLFQANDDESGDSDGTYSFSTAITQGPNANTASSTAGSSFASFLLGLDSSGEMEIDSKNTATVSEYYGLYVQDDWKATPRLSLNAGLRWDLDIPRTERHNRLESFDTSIASPLAAQTGLSGLTGGTVFVGVNGASRCQYNPQYLNFSPRFGLAYELDPNTAVRAAYGIYFGPSPRAAGATVGTEGFSAVTDTTGVNGVLPSTTPMSSPFPTGLSLPIGSSQGLLTGIGSSFENPMYGDNKVGYMQDWELSIQRQLPFGMMVDAAYVGSHGVHLNKSGEDDWNANQLTPAAMALGTALEKDVTNPLYGIITSGPEDAATIPESYLEAPFPQFTTVYLSYLSGGYALYNSFQLKVDKRLSHGLNLLASYTGEKNIDDYSGISNVGRIAGGIQNIYDLRAERAVSSNDINRNLTVSGNYNLPFGRGEQFGANWNRMLNGFLGGWQINGIMTETTGFPLAISTTNTSESGSDVLRPNLTGTSPIIHESVLSRLKEYMNPAAFSQPAAFTFGDCPRTLSNVREQGTHDIDFSLFKNFHPTERMSLQFHAEAYNLLNQVQFGAPNETFSSTSFGVISSQSNSPRQIQAALKILF